MWRGRNCRWPMPRACSAAPRRSSRCGCIAPADDCSGCSRRISRFLLSIPWRRDVVRPRARRPRSSAGCESVGLGRRRPRSQRRLHRLRCDGSLREPGPTLRPPAIRSPRPAALAPSAARARARTGGSCSSGGGAAFAATDPLGWWSASPGRGEVRRQSGVPRAYANDPADRLPDAVGRQPSAASRALRPAVLADRCDPAAGRCDPGKAHGCRRPSAGCRKDQRYPSHRGSGPIWQPCPTASSASTSSPAGSVPTAAAGDLGNGRTSCRPLVSLSSWSVRTPGPHYAAKISTATPPRRSGPAFTRQNRPRTGDQRPPKRQDFSLPPGVSFTPAEYRLLADLIQDATQSNRSSSGASGPTEANPPAGQPSR